MGMQTSYSARLQTSILSKLVQAKAKERKSSIKLLLFVMIDLKPNLFPNWVFQTNIKLLAVQIEMSKCQ